LKGRPTFTARLGAIPTFTCPHADLHEADN
jgi:hypothetical protein